MFFTNEMTTAAHCFQALADIRAQGNGLKMSQEALADAAKINQFHLGEVERGNRTVSLLPWLIWRRR